MGIRLAVAMGNTVTAISTSPRKKEAAIKMGAKNFIVSKDEEQMKGGAKSLDLILNTVSANHQGSVQGDISGCSIGFVDIETKVVFQCMLLILRRSFCNVNNT